jgi:hypothetical protein
MSIVYPRATDATYTRYLISGVGVTGVGVADEGQALVLALPPTVLRKHQAVGSNPLGTCPPPCTI